MKKLSLKVLLMLLPLLGCLQAFAQVGGISYTLSPYAEYNLFNEKSGISDGIIGGAQLGLGFGQNVELGAVYARGFSLQTDLAQFPFEATADQIAAYQAADLELERYGGEVKFNLSRGAFLPYLTLGTGIQSIGLDSTNTSKQIYFNAGLGLKVSVANRYTIGIQAMNTSYRYNAVNSLLDDTQRESYGLIKEDFLSERINNWSLRASMAFYIGGRKPGGQTDVDRAYWDNFSGGFSGLNVPLEVSYSKMNFDEDLPFRDTWMAGGSAGFNFGSLVGVRGFYWRALEEDSYTEFDGLSMYGGEARFKLNEGKGFTPWVTVGGGNIHTHEGYVGVTDTLASDNKGFAMGGLGIDLPFSKYVKATGFVKSIVTTSEDIEDLSNPEELKYSWNYGVSVNFVLGRKKKKIDVVEQSTMDDYILASEADNLAATEELKGQYENKIIALEGQLAQAITEQDAEEVQKLSEEKMKAERIVDELTKSAYTSYNAANNNGGIPMMGGMNVTSNPSQQSGINMSPAEFQLLLRDLMDAPKYAAPVAPIAAPIATGNGGDIQSAIADYNKDQQIAQLKENMSDIKLTLKDMNAMNMKLADDNNSNIEKMLSTFNDRFSTLERRLDKSSNDLDMLKQRQGTIEKSMSNTEGAVIEMESFESKQIQKDIEYTNQRLEDLRSLMIESLTRMEQKQATAPVVERVIEKEIIIEQVAPVTPKASNQTKVKSDVNNGNETGFFSKFKYKGMSGFAGFNVGGPTTFNLGYRLHYQVGSDSSKVEFMPESFFGLGSPSAFGISANVVYKIDFLTKSKMVTPYIGLGLGLMKVGDDQDADKLTGAYNFIVGSSLNVWSGDLYVDFTARNAFKYNQLIVGYRFPF